MGKNAEDLALEIPMTAMARKSVEDHHPWPRKKPDLRDQGSPVKPDLIALGDKRLTLGLRTLA